MLMKHHLRSAGRQIFQHELIAAPLLLSHSMSSCLRNIRFCTASKSFIMGILNVYIVLKRQSYQAAIIFVKKNNSALYNQYSSAGENKSFSLATPFKCLLRAANFEV